MRLTDEQFDALMARLSAHSAEGGGWWVDMACALADDRTALMDAAVTYMATIDRLRAALDEIANDPDAYAPLAVKAREALKALKEAEN